MVEKRVIVKAHAKERLNREKLYNVDEQVLIKIVKNPDELVYGRGNRLIAHKVLDKNYILRVVYEEFADQIQIVTFYRAKKERYYGGGK